MVQIDHLEGTVIAVNNATNVNSFTVNIDTSAFSPFTFPLTGFQPFSPAVVVPAGEDTAFAANNNLNQLTDAWVNVAYYGMQLAAGVNGPAGQAGDLIYWVAEKADSVNFIQPVPQYI